MKQGDKKGQWRIYLKIVLAYKNKDSYEEEHLIRVSCFDFWLIISVFMEFLKLPNYIFLKAVLKNSIHSSFIARYETAEGDHLALYRCISEVRSDKFQVLRLLVDMGSYMKFQMEVKQKEKFQEVFHKWYKNCATKIDYFRSTIMFPSSFPYVWGYLFSLVENEV